MHISIPFNDLELAVIRKKYDIPEIVFKVRDVLKKFSHCHYRFYLYYEQLHPMISFVIFKIADEGNHCFVSKMFESSFFKHYRGEIEDIVRKTVQNSVIQLSLSKLKEQTKEEKDSQKEAMNADEKLRKQVNRLKSLIKSSCCSPAAEEEAKKIISVLANHIRYLENKLEEE